MNLIGILDTENNKNRVEFDGNLESDNAIVKDLDFGVRDYTFKNLLEYMAENAEGKEMPVAQEVRDYLTQHNGSSTICEIRACDEQGNYMSNDGKEVIDLDEKVSSYVTRRNVDGEDFDCVEMTVGQITSVGGR